MSTIPIWILMWSCLAPGTHIYRRQGWAAMKYKGEYSTKAACVKESVLAREEADCHPICMKAEVIKR